MSLIRQSRGGKDYDSAYGVRMRGTGAYADLLHARFELAKRKLAYDSAHQRHTLNSASFRRPRSGPQMALEF
jgi:DNA repair photolyase